MTVQRLEHIGIVVEDLAAATAFFAALGLELEGEASVEGEPVDRINGLKGVRADIMILRTPDGNAKVELAKYRSPAYEGDDGPAPANAPGIATSSSLSTTSRHPSPRCKRMGASSSVSWSTTRTATGSAMCAARPGPSSSWRRKSADGYPTLRAEVLRRSGRGTFR
jgi:hypothetical protein